MKVENYRNSRSLWNVLESEVKKNIMDILESEEYELSENELKIYFFNNYNRYKNKTIYCVTISDLYRIQNAFTEQEPKGASYLELIIKRLLEIYINNQCYIIIYTDGQLADRLEFVNLISDTCRKLDSQDKIKIMMIGIGIDNNSEVDLRFYLNIAANVYKFTNAKGEDCNIFGFDLLEEIEQMPNGIIEFIERQSEIDIQKRLPKWVEQRDREWYNKYIGQS